MKKLIYLFILLALLPSSLAEAGLCLPISYFQDKVFDCLENDAYVRAAQSCRDKYRAEVQRKTKDLAELLTKELESSQDDKQTTKFKSTQASYQSTDAILKSTIDLGKSTRKEIVLYGEDFVRPFSWPYLDLGEFPGLYHPEVQELFRSADCYKENMEGIEKVEREFDEMIHQLEVVREQTAQLKNTAKQSEESLDTLKNTSTAFAKMKHVLPDEAKGISTGSTISKARAKNQGAADSENSSKTVAGIIQSFSAFLSGPLDIKVKSQDAEKSVGYSVWDPGSQENKPSIKEDISEHSWPKASAPIQRNEVGETSPPSESAGGFASIGATGAARFPAAITEQGSNAGTLIVSGSDRDIFGIVHQRYQRTSLYKDFSH